MFWRIEIQNKPGVLDPVGEGIKRDIADLGIAGVSGVKMLQVFIIEGDIDANGVRRISAELLCDPVIQRYRCGRLDSGIWGRKDSQAAQVEVAYNPGVMDPWEESTLKGIRDLGLAGVHSVKTGRKYVITPDPGKKQLRLISEKLLYNKVIQHIVDIRTLKKTLQAHKEVGYEFHKTDIPLRDFSDKELERLSREGQLYLNLAEMRTIKEYFTKIGRDPSDCELETLAQTWSEHCMHKTMRGRIEYRDESRSRARPRLIHNLLKETIMHATRKLDKNWCVSVFKDNAGIIRFDRDNDVCFKVETHNHPSALEPYGGAGTGTGGVIRDILGVGMGARPLLNTDVFCFGPPELSADKVPEGGLHPKRVMKGVVAGVRDYGNRMGIPTANGAVFFDERYTGNPLVYCGTVGIMPREAANKKVDSGDYVVVVGGRTGRDGIHGATFSSGELTTESESVSGGAVQIGNAITEKKVLDVLLQARDQGLYSAITDCGAGGLSSAVGEMGVDTGAIVHLDKVPLKYQGLNYTEIWISEAQERMVMSVPARKLKKLLAVFEREGVEASVIGRFTDTHRLELFYKEHKVCDLDMEFLHEGLPTVTREAVWKPRPVRSVSSRKFSDPGKTLLKILSDLNVCSKEWIIRQYDHEVQGTSVLKPLAGVTNDGPQDAAVIRPEPTSRKGLAVACGINPRFGELDPYWMAAAAVDEALRQITAVGGDISQTAILDNFCWANTSRPEILGQLVRACFGCRDASLGFSVPFISGKDSLNNEYSVGKRTIAIPPTLLISALAVIDNVEKTISADAKRSGNLVYCVGMTYAEMGGSVCYAVTGRNSSDLPRVRFQTARRIMDALGRTLRSGLGVSCHDCSEGGLAVALAESAFAGGLGMDISLKALKNRVGPASTREEALLFSESNTRFIVEVSPAKQKKFEQSLRGIPVSRLGVVTDSGRLVIRGNKKVLIDQGISDLKEAWQKPLCW